MLQRCAAQPCAALRCLLAGTAGWERQRACCMRKATPSPILQLPPRQAHPPAQLQPPTVLPPAAPAASLGRTTAPPRQPFCWWTSCRPPSAAPASATSRRRGCARAPARPPAESPRACSCARRRVCVGLVERRLPPPAASLLFAEAHHARELAGAPGARQRPAVAALLHSLQPAALQAAAGGPGSGERRHMQPAASKCPMQAAAWRASPAAS